jgi:hypothetical protein
MAEPGFNILYNVADASWNPHSKSVCNIILSEKKITKVIFDQVKQRFVSLFAAEFETSDPQEKMDLIISAAESDLVNRWFISLSKTLIVPSVLYEDNIREKLLDNHQKLEQGDVIDAFPVKRIEAELVFAYNRFFSDLMSKAGIKQFIPVDALWLDALYLKFKETTGTQAHINVGDGFISLCIFKDGSLQLYNTYPAITPEEVLYYLMFVMEQLHINPKKDHYYFSGFVKKGDDTFSLLNKYIKNLDAEERPVQFNYSLPVVDVPGHQFFQTYCTALCE